MVWGLHLQLGWLKNGSSCSEMMFSQLSTSIILMRVFRCECPLQNQHRRGSFTNKISRRWLTCINNIFRRNALKKTINFTFDHDEHFRNTNNKHIPTHWSIAWYSMIYRSQELSCVIQPGAAWSSLALKHGSIKRWKGSVKNIQKLSAKYTYIILHRTLQWQKGRHKGTCISHIIHHLVSIRKFCWFRLSNFFRRPFHLRWWWEKFPTSVFGLP